MHNVTTVSHWSSILLVVVELRLSTLGLTLPLLVALRFWLERQLISDIFPPQPYCFRTAQHGRSCCCNLHLPFDQPTPQMSKTSNSQCDLWTRKHFVHCTTAWLEVTAQTAKLLCFTQIVFWENEIWSWNDISHFEGAEGFLLLHCLINIRSGHREIFVAYVGLRWNITSFALSNSDHLLSKDMSNLLFILLSE